MELWFAVIVDQHWNPHLQELIEVQTPPTEEKQIAKKKRIQYKPVIMLRDVI